MTNNLALIQKEILKQDNMEDIVVKVTHLVIEKIMRYWINKWFYRFEEGLNKKKPKMWGYYKIFMKRIRQVVNKYSGLIEETKQAPAQRDLTRSQVVICGIIQYHIEIDMLT